jgi:hypothetical protein
MRLHITEFLDNYKPMSWHGSWEDVFFTMMGNRASRIIVDDLFIEYWKNNSFKTSLDVDADGVLLNGYHRLCAAVLANGYVTINTERMVFVKVVGKQPLCDHNCQCDLHTALWTMRSCRHGVAWFDSDVATMNQIDDHLVVFSTSFYNIALDRVAALETAVMSRFYNLGLDAHLITKEEYESLLGNDCVRAAISTG